MSAANYGQLALNAAGFITQAKKSNEKIRLLEQEQEENLAEVQRLRKETILAETSRRADLRDEYDQLIASFQASGGGVTEYNLLRHSQRAGYLKGKDEGRSLDNLDKDLKRLESQRVALIAETRAAINETTFSRNQTALGIFGDAYKIYNKSLSPYSAVSAVDADSSLTIRNT
jgi:hypothetical protein